jgi:hypothetical protein
VAVLLPPFGLIGAAAATVLAVLAQAAMRGGPPEDRPRPVALGADAVSYGIAAVLVAIALNASSRSLGDGARVATSALAAGTLLIVVRKEFRLG